METYGWLSLIPPVLAIILAWWSREVLVSLFIGVFVGATIIADFNPLVGFMRTLDKYMIENLTDSWYISILLFLIILSGMVGIITRSGATNAVAEFVAKKAKTTRRAQLATWLMGILIFFDDYANSLIVGTTMRSITDKMKISREKLAYIVDCTAAPVTSMAIISTWVGHELGLIRAAFDSLGIEANAYSTFMQTIPYRFYSIFALAMVLFIALTGKDFGPMYDAERRARKEGKVLADGATPLASDELTNMEVNPESKMKWYDAFIPMVAVVVVTIIGLWYNGTSGWTEAMPLHEAFGNADASVVLLWSSFSGTLVAIILALFKGGLSLEESMEGWINGAKALAGACGILILAWALGLVTKELGTANFLVDLSKGTIPAFMVPTMIFVISGIIAFATGTSWGTSSIIMPLAVAMAYQLGSPMMATIGAVLTGAVLGDHCSPISDTTIMSSTASAADHIDHVKTQLPYAIVVGIVAILFGFLPAGFNVPSWTVFPLLLLGMIALYLIVNYFGKAVEEN
ncbi:transporter (NhaC family) [Orenia metallireducens]|uniref:Transporter, NhaC family n=1 Tax=Orenia metallireducens TaxID=1413210 RepID=A0A285F3Z4_9FIRM|nr:Na+/H+ antiporter NhaC family protein [Orenia metallireducens]PRX34885.1 transporter (NhaC family) [Orenia metallireducens]SNY06039.1 transporter, NhaC family [Orenia metallireducens]